MPLSLSPSLLMSSASSVAFSPLSLFASGEQGAWYDPSDLSTMFQDTAGTTPVTATGQTVGLLLDKSQGLALGPELVTNGDFSSATGWTLGAGWSISGGAAVATSVAAYGELSQSASVAVGFYRVTFNVTVTAGAGFIRLGSIGNIGNFSATGSYSFILQCGAAGSSVRVLADSGGFTGSIDNISVKELPGNHATQATAASRPIYQVDGNGKAYLLFDGTDDFMLTGTITPGIDKAQVFAGVRKLSSATGIIAEIGAGTGNGRISLQDNDVASNYRWVSVGTSSSLASSAATFAAPITNVLTGIGDIAGDVATLRANGTQVATSSTDQGTGNYLAYPLYIGRRAGTSQPFNGRIYQMLVRFGANLSAATITQTENYTAGKTGIYTVEQLIRLNTLNASGVSYNAYAAADSNGNNYPVTNTVLAADGTPYSVL